MTFTDTQKEIVARKLGYDGPMQGFDEYINSSPALSSQYTMLTNKFAARMAKGGVVRKKYADGGAVVSDTTVYGPDGKSFISADAAQAAGVTNFTTVAPSEGSIANASSSSGEITGAPNIPTATTYTAATTAAPAPAVAATAAPVTTTTAQLAGPAATVSAPDKVTAGTVEAAKSTGAVSAEMGKLQAQQGTISDQAQAKAVTQEPTTTAVSGVTAAQGEAAQVGAIPTRTVQEGELITGGPTVDQAKIEQTLSKTKAEQGVVTEEMTVQGQLNKMLANFDAGSPPPWAAATMRAATAQLAARGLGASSLAGQAVIQAALEAATPIATADAKVFEQMGLTNLSNRQQTAMILAQQRATFLGQEFDQTFQTKVLNAAKISDIANKNFDAQTTVALENARLVNSMNIANLSAANAVVLAKAAQIANLETTNLNNRQLVAVENAKNFLQMDMKNLDNRQQTAIFKAKTIADAIVSDAGYENAARITNVTNKLEADKLNATLAQAAETFNATETNKINTFNANAANDISKFNAEQQNKREEFNANMATQINVANAKLLAEVSVANTAAINAANAVNAKNATDLSAQVYAQQSQTYRDLLEQSWKTGESTKDRITEIAKATLTANASTSAASTTATAGAVSAIGGAAVKLLENDKAWAAVTDAVQTVWNKFTD